MTRIFILSLIFLGVLGCLRLGPDFQKPEINFNIPKEYIHSSANHNPEQLSLAWWKSFNTPELNDLIRQVLDGNPDLIRAAARIREVEADLVIAKSDRWPNLQTEGSFTRRASSIEVAVPELAGRAETETIITDTYRLSFPASFEVDLWGRLARAEESARAILMQAEENRRTLVQSLIAETASYYITIAGLKEQERIQQVTIESFENSLELVRQRFYHGLNNLLEVKQAKRALEQSRVLLHSLREERGKAEHALAVLLGQYPAGYSFDSSFGKLWTNVIPIPSDLPSNLLARRPDIRAAEAMVRSANARIGVALANRFPNFSLTGNLGYSQTDQLENLIRPDNRFWQWALSISQTLFDRGGLKAKQKGAQARYDQEVANYVKTVLQAFSEVEDALLVRKTVRKRLDQLEVVASAARQEFQIARDRYTRGIVDLDQMLNAQRTMFQAEKSLIENKTALLSNRIRLYRVLGGDWPIKNDHKDQHSAKK